MKIYMFKLTVTHDTFIKDSPSPSAELAANQKTFIPQGEVLVATTITESQDQHFKVSLANKAGEGYIYVDHWNIDVLAINGKFSKVKKAEINWNDFNSKVSKYFTVGEVCNYDRRRIPQNKTTQSNIIKLARELDKVRAAWGGGLLVTSWHRPLHINRAIGSGDRSQHVKGKAADVRPANGKLWEFQTWIDKRWYGALGYGAKKGFVHLDNRNNKGFNTGGAKGVRWNY